MKIIKKITLLLLVPLVSILTVACLKELSEEVAMDGLVQFVVTTDRPPNQTGLSFDDFDFTILSAVLTNLQGGTHTARLNADGTTVFYVDPGVYTLSISGQFPFSENEPDNIVSVSGLLAAFLLTEQGISLDQWSLIPSKRIQLTSIGGVEPEIPLIIRELYWGGDRHVIEGRTYAQDQFVEIYNNGTRDVVIDSLFIGTLAPFNSTVARNGWWGSDTVGLAPNMFMIPARADGEPRILRSGESVVIAMASAVDLRGITQNALRLDQVHFHAWVPEFTMRETTPGVERMQRVSDVGHQGNAGIFSVTSPAVVIFKIPCFYDYFVTNRSQWIGTDPASTATRAIQHIHTDWIIDGVEVFANPTDRTKRLPLSVDAGFVWLREGRLQGNGARRHVQRVRADGTVVYMDTNNSSNDFETDVRPKPRLRPH